MLAAGVASWAKHTHAICQRGSGSRAPPFLLLSTASYSRVAFGNVPSHFIVEMTEIGGLALTSSQ